MTVSGSIESVAIHGRRFAVAADAESQRKLGGFENELQANGDGTGRTVQTRVNWMLDGLSLEIDDDIGDLEFLQDIADRGANGFITITYASGIVYQGTGTVIGELQGSSQNATGSVGLSGPGKLTKQ